MTMLSDEQKVLFSEIYDGILNNIDDVSLVTLVENYFKTFKEDEPVILVAQFDEKLFSLIKIAKNKNKKDIIKRFNDQILKQQNKDPKLCSSLISAVFQRGDNDLKTIETLLMQNVSPDTSAKYEPTGTATDMLRSAAGMTMDSPEYALILAIKNGYVKTAELLLAFGANPYITSKTTWNTVLHEILSSKHPLDFINMLLRLNCDFSQFNQKNLTDKTPIDILVNVFKKFFTTFCFSELDDMLLLEELGKVVGVLVENKLTTWDKVIEKIETSLEDEYRRNGNEYRHYPEGRRFIMQGLRERDELKRNRNNQTPLQVASPQSQPTAQHRAEKTRSSSSSSLSNSDALVKVIFKKSDNHLIFIDGLLSLNKELLNTLAQYIPTGFWTGSARSTVGMKMDFPEYPLMLAINKGQVDTAKLLLQRGADPYVVNPTTGNTVLHEIISSDNGDAFIERLQANKVDFSSLFNVKNKKGKTPRDILLLNLNKHIYTLSHHLSLGHQAIGHEDNPYRDVLFTKLAPMLTRLVKEGLITCDELIDDSEALLAGTYPEVESSIVRGRHYQILSKLVLYSLIKKVEPNHPIISPEIASQTKLPQSVENTSRNALHAAFKKDNNWKTIEYLLSLDKFKNTMVHEISEDADFVGKTPLEIAVENGSVENLRSFMRSKYAQEIVSKSPDYLKKIIDNSLKSDDKNVLLCAGLLYSSAQVLGGNDYSPDNLSSDKNFKERQLQQRIAVIKHLYKRKDIQADTEALEELLDAGAPANVYEQYQVSGPATGWLRANLGMQMDFPEYALILSIKKNNLSAFKLLLEHGANPFITSKETGNNVFHEIMLAKYGLHHDGSYEYMFHLKKLTSNLSQLELLTAQNNAQQTPLDILIERISRKLMGYAYSLTYDVADSDDCEKFFKQTLLIAQVFIARDLIRWDDLQAKVLAHYDKFKNVTEEDKNRRKMLMANAITEIQSPASIYKKMSLLPVLPQQVSNSYAETQPALTQPPIVTHHSYPDDYVKIYPDLTQLEKPVEQQVSSSSSTTTPIRYQPSPYTPPKTTEELFEGADPVPKHIPNAAPDSDATSEPEESSSNKSKKNEGPLHN
jgi:ankyrin repeat protein